MKKFCSVFLALVLTLQIGTFVPATQGRAATITVTPANGGASQTLTQDYLIIEEDGTYTVQGKLDATNPNGTPDTAIQMDAPQQNSTAPIKATVNVTGDVEGKNGISVADHVDVTVHGDVEGTSQQAIMAVDHSSVQVDGDVTAVDIAINMPNDKANTFTSTPNGNGTSTTTRTSKKLADNEATVKVKGNVSSEKGITVFVEGKGTVKRNQGNFRAYGSAHRGAWA